MTAERERQKAVCSVLFFLLSLGTSEDTGHIRSPPKAGRLQIKEPFLLSFNAHLFHPPFKSYRSQATCLKD